MENYIELEVISASGSSIREKVKELYIPAYKGETGILYNHLPYITLLKSGKMRYLDSKEKQHYFYIEDGSFELNDNKAVLLSNNIQAAEDMDKAKISQELSDIKKEIDSASKDSKKVEKLDEFLKKERELSCKLEILQIMAD